MWCGGVLGLDPSGGKSEVTSFAVCVVEGGGEGDLVRVEAARELDMSVGLIVRDRTMVQTFTIDSVGSSRGQDLSMSISKDVMDNDREEP